MLIQLKQNIEGYAAFTNLPPQAAKSVKKDLSQDQEPARTRIVGGHPVGRPSYTEPQDELTEQVKEAVQSHIIGSNPLLAGAATILGLGAKRPRTELKH